jgi:hypothetical protein
VIIFATVSLQITSAAGFDHNTVVSQVSAAIATNINSLGLGVDLPYSILAGWAYAVKGVTKVSAVLLNGVSGDIANLTTSKLTQDGKTSISYATVKCQSVIAS